MYPQLLKYLKRRKFDYFYLDVDPSAVDSSRVMAEAYGFFGDHFSIGFNDQFSFSDATFDAVFSSHCIEHSFDLSSTFRELCRIIKTGGNLLMAVPLGWEENPEHPYFFGVDHWVALVEDAGFEIRVAQIGQEYPEIGHDLFIAARKITESKPDWRIDPNDYRKESFKFIGHDSEIISYSGNYSLTAQGDASHLRGHDWTMTIALPKIVEILPIFVKHPWSGIVQISGGGQLSYHDLFSWFTTIQPARHTPITPDEASRIFTIKPCGKNPASWAAEAVVHGFMYREMNDLL